MRTLEDIFNTLGTHQQSIETYIEFGDLEEYVEAVQENVVYFALKTYLEKKYSIPKSDKADKMFALIWKINADRGREWRESEEFFEIYYAFTQIIDEEMNK